jgi:hypothetical protein
MLDPPLSVLPAAEPTPTQPIPDSVPEDVKRLLQKFPSILRTGDVMPTPTHGVEHHIHTGSQPQFLQNPATWIQKNLRLQKHCSPFKITMGLSFAHGSQKRWILATLW